MVIINKQDKCIEYQADRTENWMGDDWIAVPSELVSAVGANAPYCDLVIENGVLVDVIATEKPKLEPPTPEPTEMEVLQQENRKLSAQVSALTESGQMLEDCIIEMAAIVYA